MSKANPVIFGSVGLGGYGGVILNLLRRGEKHVAPGGGPLVTLYAVCEPDYVLHAERIAELRGQGVLVFEKYEDLLAQPIEAVWLPLPIDLHATYSIKALEAGKAVMCEKPAAGSIDDLDRMIAARNRASRPAAIGFQDVYDPAMMELKRSLLSGTIGRLRHATVHACWPRNQTYYTRASWVAKFKRNGVWVMDSPVQNALAHYLNIALFLLGDSEGVSAQPTFVEAELYRVNPIENYDTISMRLKLDNGLTLLLHFTHACEQTIHPRVVIHGDGGMIERANNESTIVTPKGRFTNQRNLEELGMYSLEQFCRLVRGNPDPDRGIATLEVARAHLLAVNGASEAATITDVPPESKQAVVDVQGTQLNVIPRIEAAFETCSKEDKMLHESKLFSWTVPAGRKSLEGYSHFAGPRI